MSDVYGFSGHIHVQLSYVLLTQSCRLAFSYLRHNVVADHDMFSFGLYMDYKGCFWVYSIMLGSVLDQKLYRARRHITGHLVFRYIYDYIETFGKTYLEQIDIKLGKGKFVS